MSNLLTAIRIACIVLLAIGRPEPRPCCDHTGGHDHNSVVNSP
jgi:hypothetical protein